MSTGGAVVEPPELKKFTGMQRAAAMMLALGQQHGAPIWDQLTNEEIKELSAAIAQLGRVPTVVIEFLMVEFTSAVSSMSALHGSFESTERLLESLMPSDKVKEIMEDIRGPSGRTMWDKLSNVSEAVLAGYLKNEYPQTIAVILNKLRPDHAARVLSELPQELGIDVIMRMLRMETVQKDVLQHVEQTLKSEFMTNFSRTQRRDTHESMAELFNALDRTTEEAMLAALDEKAPESATRIRALMFTFEDLANLLPAAIQTLVRASNKRDLALALKGAPEETRKVFFKVMTERAAKLMRDDMSAMGPVRARDCEEAQGTLVRLAKTLADQGEIVLVDPKSDDAMIF
ncbi:flagellar motor switch protein FliG [Novosphingobium profundi]|uniref:flagellar motor switch protein FliG n=1 Tax=Novosphingobium profundi TaxID=1774954 RepID=UPI001BDAC708|nr:flagellar motor switch protein FliG [Novosphingobium profundi]MBT0670531.1 flagellar motor switch protein FliG [Novosphingobium profundi]